MTPTLIKTVKLSGIKKPTQELKEIDSKLVPGYGRFHGAGFEVFVTKESRWIEYDPKNPVDKQILAAYRGAIDPHVYEYKKSLDKHPDLLYWAVMKELQVNKPVMVIINNTPFTLERKEDVYEICSWN